MLCLTIKHGEFVQIGDAKVRVIEIDKGKVRLGIEAPKEVVVLRERHTKTKIRRAS